MRSRQLVAYLQATARPAKLHTHTRPTPTHVNFHAAPTMTPTLTPTLTSTLPSPTFRLVCNQPASYCGFATRSPTLTSTLIPTMTPTMTPTFRLVCNQPASCCGFATRTALCFLCFPGSQTRPRELAGCKPARTWESAWKSSWKPAHPRWERRRSVLPNMPFRPAKQHISQAKAQPPAKRPMLSRQLVAYLQATARPAKLHTHTRPTPTCDDFHDDPTMTSTLIPTMTSTLPSPTFRLVCNQPASYCGFATRSPTLTSTLIPTMTPTMTLVCNQPASCCGFSTRAVLCFLCFPGSQTRPRELAGCKPARTWEKRGRNVETRSPTLASTFTHVNLHADFHLKPGRLSIKIVRT